MASEKKAQEKTDRALDEERETEYTTPVPKAKATHAPAPKKVEEPKKAEPKKDPVVAAREKFEEARFALEDAYRDEQLKLAAASKAARE